MPRGRYYLGRDIKMGQLDMAKLFEAILESPTVQIGKFAWAFTDIVDGRDSDPPFLFGHLSKFSHAGQITVVDTASKAQVDTTAENLLVASSPFVFLPDYSGIAYMHVWNGIQEEVFPRRFKKIVESKYEDFFVDCSIEPVADYRKFAARLTELDSFEEISAKVHPPNPLFGRLWRSLRKYVDSRNASELTVREVSDSQAGLKTKVVEHMESLLKDSGYSPDVEPDITDLALLMSADGYGSGKVVGKREGQDVVVKTSETKKSFLFEKSPLADQLALESAEHFRKVNEERDMGH